MYINYFKLNEPPFSLTPDPRFLFMSERHREGLAHLLYGVQQPGGFVQLTGDIGSGKTTLCRCLIKQLPPDTDVALILNPRLTVVELLATVCDELRIPYPAETGSIKILIDALNRHLLETHAQRRRTVLIIDEAQNLHSDVLEQVRLLTNLETSQEKLLQIILIGQPELLALLKGAKLTPTSSTGCSSPGGAIRSSPGGQCAVCTAFQAACRASSILSAIGPCSAPIRWIRNASALPLSAVPAGKPRDSCRGTDAFVSHGWLRFPC
jgi:hypothetical protein